VYAVVASVSRLAALTGTFFALVGIFLIARIPWVEGGVGHDRLVTLVAITKLLRTCDLSQLPMMDSDSPPLLPSFHSL